MCDTRTPLPPSAMRPSVAKFDGSWTGSTLALRASRARAQYVEDADAAAGSKQRHVVDRSTFMQAAASPAYTASMKES